MTGLITVQPMRDSLANRKTISSAAGRIFCAFARSCIVHLARRSELKCLLILPFLALQIAAADPQVGDMDGDGRITVLDVVRIVALSRTGTAGASARTVAIADVNQDGAVNDGDASLVATAAAGLLALPTLPLDTVRDTSPGAGEDGVAVTRETVFHLTMPLADTATVNVNSLHATAAGRQILSRVEVASDRRTVTLFYLEPLPGSARVHVTFDSAGLLDFLGRGVDLDGDGATGGTATLDFDTLSLSAVTNTAVTGRVFASEARGAGTAPLDTPIAGVTITVDGMEQAMRTVTDAQGNFRLATVPAGAFFVHIDGRTVTNLTAGIRYPDMSYYPFVGKRWVSIAGQEVNIGDVFLPLIVTNTLQVTAAGSPTVVKFPTSVVTQNPALANVSLQVPADDLFREDGTRGGRIGIAPVPPDRLPGPLPEGVNPAIVITIQTDGPANFDRPVPACFPNLPDASSGQKLAPGGKSALWSFNHDTGRFEIVGSATVSDDGTLVCSDPGVGILAPGWHFIAQGIRALFGGSDCGPTGSNSRNEPGTQSRTPGKPGKGPCDPKPSGNGGRTAGDPIQLFSGQMLEEVTDLEIPGRGFNFVWQRTYRSQTGPNTEQGNGWDHPYHVYIEATGTNLTVHEGNGRGDLYMKQADGTWTRAEYFRVLSRETDGSYTLTFEDKGHWGFYPLDATTHAGRMSFSEDRNGNRMSFSYDARGRLTVVNDTLGRDITIAYDSNGFIQSVTDFAGRTIRYEYYKNGDAGGTFGDLKSVTTAAVNNTPNGNDFPNGKTTTYIYSTGFADERLNHNLLSITDGRRNDPSDSTFGLGPYLVNIYSTATDPNDPSFDHIVRQVWGGGILDFTYVPLMAAAPNGFAVTRTIVHDRVGNVTEHFFDANNRLVRLRQYTGRANPDQATTALDNRPQNPLRPNDPDYFETIYEWTSDALQRRVIHANGNITEYTYEADLNPNASARTRGNLRKIRHLPGTHLPAGDQPVIEENFAYDTDFGSCCGFNFLTQETDGRANSTRHEYDLRGNRVRTVDALAGVTDEWEYNQFGQTIAHIFPPDSAGRRRRDQFEFYDSGPQKGYLKREVLDVSVLQLSTSYEYDAVGNIIRVVDPRGNDTIRTVNQLNQVVRVLSPEVTTGSGVRYRRDYFYDANDNVIRTDTRNLDEKGVVQANSDLTTRIEYEILNMPVRVSSEIDETHSAVREFAYDGNRNRTLIRQPEAVSGHQPANVTKIIYDERNLPYQIVAAPGDATQSTAQMDYDPNGNRIRALDGIEAGAHIATFEYDGFDRMVASTDAMGNIRRQQFDAANNLVHLRTEGELVDQPGSANNVLLADITRAFDELNRVTRIDEAHFDLASQQPIADGKATRRMEYALNSQLTRVINDNNHDLRYSYDSAFRLSQITDAKGDTVSRTYDLSGNVVAVTRVEKSDLGGPDASFTTQFAFDNLNRVIRTTDNAGNLGDFAYDSRNNRILLIDAARASANAPGNMTRNTYDGLDRLVQVTRVLTSDGTGAGNAVGEIVMRREWDDDGRLVSASDGNSNVTRYTYDPLDRLATTVLASGATKSVRHDAHSDTISTIDPNGTVVQQTFDALDRLTHKQITPGVGVASDTTSEEWSYDGASRVVRAANNLTQTTLGYDSLGNLTRDSIDGRTAARTYDGEANPVLTVYPSGRKITATFDDLERVKSQSDSTSTTPAAIASYDYAGPRRLARRSNGNNTRLDMSYDTAPNLTRSTHSIAGGAAFEDREYQWDANYNQVASRDRLPGGLNQAYSYDSAYRLRTVAFTGSLNEQRIYQLDAAGNRLSVTGAGDAGAYNLAPTPSTDALLNQYTSTPFDERTYDSDGNLTKVTAAGQETVLGYDYANRLVHFVSAGRTNRYVYDALGRRVARSTGPGASGTVLYSYFGLQALEEEDGAGVPQATYVLGVVLNDIVSMQRGGKNYWLHSDDKFSVRRITDSTGAVVESYTYDEFGNPASFDGAARPINSSAIGNPHLFTGHRYDPESGLYFARSRYYEPRSGRFISRDPAGQFGDSINLGNAFTYAGNNPATLVDPRGLTGTRPRPGEFVGPGMDAAAADLLRRGTQVGEKAAEASAEALRVNNTMANELLDTAEAYLRDGSYELEVINGESVGEKGLVVFENGVRKVIYPELIHTEVNSVEEAAQMTNFRYSYGKGKDWLQEMTKRAQALDEEGAALAQKASRLRTAGKVLGVATVALQTGMAIYDDYKNCMDGLMIANDAVGTAASSAVLLAAPPLALADLATGGSVSTGLHNAAVTPGTIAKLRWGRVNGRDAEAIKSTYTRNWLGRAAWEAGEYWADSGPVSWLADKIVGN